MNRGTREGFYALWTVAILVSLCACLFVLVWVSITSGGQAADIPPADVPVQDGTQTQDGAAAPDGTAAGDGTQAAGDAIALPGDDLPAADGTQAAAPAASGVTLGETSDMGMDYQNRLIFLGDSTTYGLFSYGVLPQYQVWTPASGTMSLFNYAVETIDYHSPGGANASQSLPIMDCAADCQPEYLVITLGLNGISILDETQFKEYYASLIRDVRYASPNTKIICNSIYPVVDSLTTDDIKNDKINTANGWILAVAEENDCRYLNTHDALVDDSGNLSSQYLDPDSDGIHMNASGYSAILQYVRTHAWT